jgi:methionyl-tRNA formyltransferase
LKVLIASSSFVSKPLISLLSSSNEHELLGLITNPDKATGRGMNIVPNELAGWGMSNGINVLKPIGRDNLKDLIKTLNPEIVITIAYGQIIPEDLLDLPKYGWINVHFSSLPRWRGAAPVQWAILSSDTESGVTVFKLDKGMDTGPVYLTKTVSIDPNETTELLLTRLSNIGADLAIQSLAVIQSGTEPVAQLNSGVTLAPKITKNDGKINWHENTSEIFNRYRALAGNPGIWTLLGEVRLKIDSLDISNRTEKLSPSEVLISDEHLLVGANNGVIEIKTITPAGRSQMSAAEFIRGLPNRSGLKLG